MSGSGPPYWVSKQNEALLRASHESERRDYLDQIAALRKENEELKKQVAELKQQNESLSKRVHDLEKPS